MYHGTSHLLGTKRGNKKRTFYFFIFFTCFVSRCRAATYGRHSIRRPSGKRSLLWVSASDRWGTRAWSRGRLPHTEDLGAVATPGGREKGRVTRSAIRSAAKASSKRMKRSWTKSRDPGVSGEPSRRATKRGNGTQPRGLQPLYGTRGSRWEV